MSHHARRFSAAALLLAAAFAPGCSDDEPTTPTATLVGTWNATHLTALGTNAISLGMTASVTFTNSNAFTLVITGDLVGFCGESITSCTETGTYTATTTQLTMDPVDGDPITVNYSITGNTMTWTGSLAGIPATVTLAKQ